MRNAFISRFANEPALFAPHLRDQFVANLTALQRGLDAVGNQAKEMASDNFWPEAGSWAAQFRPYVVKDGILQIPIKGVLMHDFNWQIFTFATGYGYVKKAIERGLADENVRGIALLINSGGGEVAGNFDLVDTIFNARGKKPIRAFASEHAYSAAYSIASAADSITVARTGGVGSIGVVTSHVDYSEALEEAGIKVTFIHAGKHKVDGNPYEALSAEVKERIQERIDSLYKVFVATVARNRGISEEDVRATEALTFTASEALSKRLADNIGSLDDGLAAFAADLKLNNGGTIMSNQKDTATVDQTAIDAAKAEGRAEGKAEGHKEGVQAERARISGILNSDAAKTRAKAAANIALTTDMTVEQATGLLNTLGEEAAQAPAATAGKTPFETAMEGSGNPNLGAGAEKTEKSDADTILADYKSAGGKVRA